MKHLGSIVHMKGYLVEPVDCITFGSPCQDLSVSGKRAGLEGERSGLFMEAVRIIKEMRAATNGIYPAFAVWENVPGAFSSNKGEDFRTVLSELVGLCQEENDVPRPPKGKWHTSGLIAGDGWSLAWRTHDAQHWGVPQRRRRIGLVVDFGGDSAGEILFEREGVSGDHPSVPQCWKAASTGFVPCVGGAERETAYCIAGNVVDRHAVTCPPVSGTILASRAGTQYAANVEGCHEYLIVDDQGGSNVRVEHPNTIPTLRSEAHGNLPVVFEQRVSGHVSVGDTCGTLMTNPSASAQGTQLLFEMRLNQSEYRESSITQPQLARQYKSATDLVVNKRVRRLTVTECERLQGYPDGWTAGGSDTARYKALGNSIALPFWRWMFDRMAEYLPQGATLGSLFDGIGGFPLCWERSRVQGRAVWASEIEKFPIEVTQRWFPEED